MYSCEELLQFLTMQYRNVIIIWKKTKKLIKKSYHKGSPQFAWWNGYQLSVTREKQQEIKNVFKGTL